MIELPPSFIHSAPDGFSYNVKQFKKNVVSIWCRHHNQYNYNGGDPVATIWGFYNTKTETYFPPINSKRMGNDPIDIDKTTPYTAMQLNFKGLEAFFV